VFAVLTPVLTILCVLMIFFFPASVGGTDCGT
jgi:hypothetical protein